jgi:hypothetical protein
MDANERRAVFTDVNTFSSQSIQLGDYRLTTSAQKELSVGFKEFDYKASLALSCDNIWDYLQSSLSTELPANFSVSDFELLLYDAQTGKKILLLDDEVKSAEKSVAIKSFAGKTVYIKPLANIKGVEETAMEFSLVNVLSDKSGEMAKPGADFVFADKIPDQYVLFQNYPNPFNPITTIRYALPGQAQVDLAVYDIQGRLIRTGFGSPRGGPA